ncbi:hypothetical protein DN730_10315 [Marinomonas piezotolerans]|uniref:Glycosyltransferase family 1 protein n=1 Tax=Marinomonas piezotolerans TaxID=2213058 RepID=A0A370U8B9_9GAMM|nr:hypothetical protein [Marinomonas piezotolerans]RDL44021.1 hypothetical protein DN730_10315 [Marinomonas piezotolerans]
MIESSLENLKDSGFMDCISEKTNLEKDAVYGFFYNFILFESKSDKVSRSFFLSFLVLFFVPIRLLFKFNRKNKSFHDVAFNIWNDDYKVKVYEEYYKDLVSLLGLKSIFHLNSFSKKERVGDKEYVAQYIDKVLVLKLLFNVCFNLKVLRQCYVLSRLYKVNLFYVLARFMNVFFKSHGLAKDIRVKVYVTANDLSASLLNYFMFKKFGIKYILIQSSLRDSRLLQYKGADIIYCYGEHQKSLYDSKVNQFARIVSCGSIKNANYLNKKTIKEYDVLLVEQYSDKSDYIYSTNESYMKILKNFIRFSQEFPNLKLVYRTRPDKRSQRGRIKIYDSIFNELENSSIEQDSEGASYDRVIRSKLVIGYFSTLCFESIGLGVPATFFYYNDHQFEVFDYDNSGEDVLVTDSSYEVFKNKLLDRLNSDNSDYFSKYKSIYMNQKDGLIETISEDIKKSVL